MCIHVLVLISGSCSSEFVSNLDTIGTSIFEVDTERCPQLIVSNFRK